MRSICLAVVLLAASPALAGGSATSPPALATHVGERIELEGIAESRKLGPAVHGADFDAWVDAPSEWPADVAGHRVRVSGVLEERHDLPVFVRKPGEPIVAGIPEPEGTDLSAASLRYMLRDAHWAVVDGQAQDPPGDIAIEYVERTGSIPPPGYAATVFSVTPTGQFRIELSEGGHARIDVSPDRLRDIRRAAERYQRTYEARQDMQMLAWRLGTVGCFPSRTPPPPGRCAPPPGRRMTRVGGAYCTITVTPGRLGEELPCDDSDNGFSPELEPMRDELVKALRGLVPGRTWQCLRERREHFVRDFERIRLHEGMTRAREIALLERFDSSKWSCP